MGKYTIRYVNPGDSHIYECSVIRDTEDAAIRWFQNCFKNAAIVSIDFPTR